MALVSVPTNHIMFYRSVKGLRDNNNLNLRYGLCPTSYAVYHFLYAKINYPSQSGAGDVIRDAVREAALAPTEA